MTRSDFSTRNGGPPKKVTKAELRAHKSEFDCWTAYRGKVYNVTQYMDFHPGGKKMLMSVAGKDSTALYDKYHRWVNAESILAKAIVGILVDDPDEEPIIEPEKPRRNSKEISAAALANLTLDDDDAEDSVIKKTTNEKRKSISIPLVSSSSSAVQSTSGNVAKDSSELVEEQGEQHSTSESTKDKAQATEMPVKDSSNETIFTKIENDVKTPNNKSSLS